MFKGEVGAILSATVSGDELYLMKHSQRMYIKMYPKNHCFLQQAQFRNMYWIMVICKFFKMK